jgi:hypothetical protein
MGTGKAPPSGRRPLSNASRTLPGPIAIAEIASNELNRNGTAYAAQFARHQAERIAAGILLHLLASSDRGGALTKRRTPIPYEETADLS